MSRPKDANEAIERANGALQLYAQYWGSSTKEFGEQFDLIIKILEANAAQMESPFDKALVLSYTEALKVNTRAAG